MGFLNIGFKKFSRYARSFSVMAVFCYTSFRLLPVPWLNAIYDILDCGSYTI
jgi:hypothetical protein